MSDRGAMWGWFWTGVIVFLAGSLVGGFVAHTMSTHWTGSWVDCFFALTQTFFLLILFGIAVYCFLQMLAQRNH